MTKREQVKQNENRNKGRPASRQEQDSRAHTQGSERSEQRVAEKERPASEGKRKEQAKDQTTETKLSKSNKTQI